MKPKIVAVPESGLIKVKAGEPVELSCKVTQGYPAPEVLWRRKVSLNKIKYRGLNNSIMQERPMPTGEDFISGQSIYYPTTTRHHSGSYTCTADNRATETATAEVFVI